MKKTILFAIAATALSFSAATPGFADSLLSGETVDVQYVVAQDSGYTPLNDPNGYEVFQDFGPAVVPTGSTYNGVYYGVFNLSVDDTTETITDTNAGAAFGGSSYDQGLLLTITGPVTISGVTLDAASTIGTSSDVDFTTSQIFYSVNDLNFVSGTAILDISGNNAAAPEPGTLLSSVTGLGLVMFGLRRKLRPSRQSE